MVADASESDVVAYLRETHAAAFDLAVWARGIVLEAEPDFTERVYRGWGGIGFRHPSAGYICALYPRPQGDVRLLFEYGAALPDPEGVLEGEGTQTRYLTLTAPGVDAADTIRALVQRAVAERLPLP